MHKLDEKVEEILQHYGIKGMKWNIRRSEEEIKEDIQNGVNAAGEALEDVGDDIAGNDSIGEELGDVIDVAFGGKGDIGKEASELKDAIKDKLEDIGNEIKERGTRILTNLFGKAEKTKKTTVYVDESKRD